MSRIFIVGSVAGGIVVASESPYSCPGSPAMFHAKSTQLSKISELGDKPACEEAKQEILDRIAGKDGWYDPHNKGQYSLLSNKTSGDGSTIFQLERRTGNGKYTDKIDLHFVPESQVQGFKTCLVYGCSESQVTSFLDFSTNFCNIRMLTCGKADGCKNAGSGFGRSYIIENTQSRGSGSKMSDCLKVGERDIVNIKSITEAVPPVEEALPLFPQLRQELVSKGLDLTATATEGQGQYYVFLQKFPLTGSILGLKVFHTEVVVCHRGQFDTKDQSLLDGLISGIGHEGFAQVGDSWWSSRNNAVCFQLGYGGANCQQECCSVGTTGAYPLSSRSAVIFNADGSHKSMYIYGTGSFDGRTAYHHTCDKKCWSNWAGTDYNILTNNCNTFTSTVLSAVYGLSQKKPNLGVSDMTTVHGHCPSTTTSDVVV